jgi:hypothetical protein
MNSGKKKSPSWRPWDKRRTPAQFRAKRAVVQEATARRDCDRRRFWRSCPVLQCQRVARCGGEPARCQERSRPAIAQHRDAAPRAANVAAQTAAPQRPAAPVMSAAEAAAAIKASIAGLPPDPSAGDEMETWYCDGRIEYRPRKR